MTWCAQWAGCCGDVILFRVECDWRWVMKRGEGNPIIIICLKGTRATRKLTINITFSNHHATHYGLKWTCRTLIEPLTMVSQWCHMFLFKFNMLFCAISRREFICKAAQVLTEVCSDPSMTFFSSRCLHSTGERGLLLRLHYWCISPFHCYGPNTVQEWTANHSYRGVG